MLPCLVLQGYGGDILTDTHPLTRKGPFLLGFWLPKVPTGQGIISISLEAAAGPGGHTARWKQAYVSHRQWGLLALPGAHIFPNPLPF